MVRVLFQNASKTDYWLADLPEWSGFNLLKEINQQQVLGTASPDIWFDENHGKIYLDGIKLVGMFRKVEGTRFKQEENTPSAELKAKTELKANAEI